MSSESNETDDFLVISTVIPGVSSVRLYLETIEHIRERHPEVVDLAGVDGIVATVSTPTRVHDGNTDPGETFVFVSDNVRYGNASLHVPVKWVDGTSGRVRTAIFKSGSSTSQVLWRVADAT